MKRARYALLAAAVGLTAAIAIASGGGASSDPGNVFYPLPPSRALDTRNAANLVEGEQRTVQITGHSGVPMGASAVVANITVTETTEWSYLTVWPSGAHRPQASVINWTTADQTIANAITVQLGDGGALAVYNAFGNADVIVDVMGYYLSAGPQSTAPTTTTTTPPSTSTTTQPPPVEGFPTAATTGVPDGVALTPYAGPCTITTAGTVVDAKTVNCDLRIQAANVTIRNSRILSVATDENSTGYSFTIVDSEVHVGDRPGTGVGAVNFTMLRVEVTGGNRSVNCWKQCDIRDSYVHGQMSDETGVYHESGIRMGAGGTLVHNTIACDAPDFPPDAGCSAALTGYGDFAAVTDMLIERNLFKATTGGFCAYGGSSAGKPYTSGARDIRFIGNTFERGPGGKCGYWGAITDYSALQPGNVWSDNVWDDGAALNP